MKPYTGKVLWVDLAQLTFTEEIIPDNTYRKYLAGIGLGAYLLYREIPPKADPLGPDNILGFMSGLLNGTGSLFTGRWMAVGKSPLTGTWGDSNCGGTLAFAINSVMMAFSLGVSAKNQYIYLSTVTAHSCVMRLTCGEKTPLRRKKSCWKSMAEKRRQSPPSARPEKICH